MEVEKIREEYKLPGITAAFVRSDGTNGSAAAGVADLESEQPMTGHSRMLAASIGKSFVGALSITLASKGKLDLDEPVSRWLGKYDWFKRLPNHRSITMRHLLTHTSGIPDHVHMESFQKTFASEWRASDNPFTPQRLIGFTLDTPALFPAGHGWVYTDTGYLLAGLVIEEVTGETYYDLVEKRFIKPLGLSSTSPSNRRDLNDLAAGYMHPNNPFGLPEKTLDNKGQLYLHPGIEWAGGGLITTSRDLAQWGDALFSGDALTHDNRSELFTSVPIDPNMPGIEYGAGVSIYKETPVGPVYGHSGWIPGYISSLRHYKDKGVTIAFQINTDTGDITDNEGASKAIEMRLLKAVLNERDRADKDGINQ